MKGVLIDKGKKNGTFLTVKGEFVKGKHKNRDIGEEFVIERSIIDMKKTALIMMLVITLVGGYIPYSVYAIPYGYAEIDINPSVELGYNEGMEVTKIKAFNSEGRDLIKNITDEDGNDIELKGMILKEAVNAVIAYATDQNYNTETVVVTYTHSDDDEVDEEVKSTLCDIYDGDGKVTCVEVAKEDYDEFRNQYKAGQENTPPAANVLKEKIADLQTELDDDDRFEELKGDYDLENCKVSELAHIRNTIKKEIQEEKKAEKANGNQEQNKEENENSGETMNQEKENNGKDNAPGQNKDKTKGNEDNGGNSDSSEDANDTEDQGDNGQGTDNKGNNGNNGIGNGN